MIQINDKVYFGRGPVEFVGVVTACAPDKVAVRGVEIGCQARECRSVDITAVDNLLLVNAAEWERLTQNEPAFADSMSRERFLALQKELEGLELSIARGEETERTDDRIKEIDLLMSVSPWMMCPDEGCIAKTAMPV